MTVANILDIESRLDDAQYKYHVTLFNLKQ